MAELEPELAELHKKLEHHILEQKSNWKSFVYAQQMSFYQGFDEIKLPGCRPTEQRLERYDIKKYLTTEKVALDIGCNCGFLVLHLSKFLKHVDGVEINPYLVNIGKDTQEFLNINNVDLHPSRFEDFKTTKKFDIIFSLIKRFPFSGFNTPDKMSPRVVLPLPLSPITPRISFFSSLRLILLRT